MGWFIRILIILVLLRLLWRLLMGPIRRPRRDRKPPPSAMPLVRDPVCGTFVLPDRAVKVMARGEPVYFCSEDCRGKYDGGAPP